jgi:RimJ/RimL family protein N-acetyltransferase
LRSYLTPDERRELLTLVAELRALEQDIERARATARRANVGPGLDDLLSPPPAGHAAVHGELVRLPDGGQIVIRPIEPADAHELAVGVRRLTALSRLRSFREPIDDLPAEELAELTAVDHESHEALVAFDPVTGEGIGVARYVRTPGDPSQAEFACAVLDRWQRRGVGTALVERLAVRARAVGIDRFTALTVVGNEPARRLLARVSDAVTEHRSGGTLEFSGPVADPGS